MECSLTGARQPGGRLAGLSAAGKPLLVRYDLARLAASIGKEALSRRAPDLWRYREFLPVRHGASLVSLGETMTPPIAAPRLAARLVRRGIIFKDDGSI